MPLKQNNLVQFVANVLNKIKKIAILFNFFQFRDKTRLFNATPNLSPVFLKWDQTQVLRSQALEFTAKQSLLTNEKASTILTISSARPDISIVFLLRVSFSRNNAFFSGLSLAQFCSKARYFGRERSQRAHRTEFFQRLKTKANLWDQYRLMEHGIRKIFVILLVFF